MRKRFILSLAVLILLALNKGNAGVVLDGGPGNGAAPPTLGPYTMTEFGLNNADPPPGSTALTAIASPLAGDLNFSFGLAHERTDPSGPYTFWNPSVPWGQGHVYYGDVYVAQVGGAYSLRITLPANTPAFYFYMQPIFDPSAPSNIPIYFQVNDDSIGATGDVVAGRTVGSQYVGFYESTPGHSLHDILLTSPTPMAIGEFGITTVTVPEPSSLALGALAALGLLIARGMLRRVRKPGPRVG